MDCAQRERDPNPEMHADTGGLAMCSPQWVRQRQCSSNTICIFISYVNIFFVLFLCNIINITEAAAARIKLPENASVSAVIIFGDSIVDTGNNNNNFKTLARSNFLPYGKDLKGGMPTGRFSNGKVPSDLIGYHPPHYFIQHC